MAKRKLDGAVDESSADQEIRKSDATVHNPGKIWSLHLAEPGLTAGRLAVQQRRGLKFLNLAVD